MLAVSLKDLEIRYVRRAPDRCAVTRDKKALVKDGVATLNLDERKVIVRPWLESLA